MLRCTSASTTWWTRDFLHEIWEIIPFFIGVRKPGNSIETGATGSRNIAGVGAEHAQHLALARKSRPDATRVPRDFFRSLPCTLDCSQLEGEPCFFVIGGQLYRQSFVRRLCAESCCSTAAESEAEAITVNWLTLVVIKIRGQMDRSTAGLASARHRQDALRHWALTKM